MRNSLKKVFCLFILLSFFDTTFSQILRKRFTDLMGSRFDISIVAQDSVAAELFINQVIEEIDRIEQLISDWIPASQVSQINQNAGIRPVKVDRELFELTKRAIYLSELTDGAFDITFAAMDKIWNFDGTMETMPDSTDIKRAISKIGYQYIVLDSLASTVFLKLPGMKIGFGATGKGYAADSGRSLMLSKNVKAGIVNASGDMALWGRQPNGRRWKIGITNPFKKYKNADVLSLSNAALTTSGDYQKFVEFDGIRYAHIINPRTGMPSTGLTSVTVIGPSAEIANGFSTAIMVLGIKKGLALLKKHHNYAALVISQSGKITKSGNYKRVKKRHGF